MDKSEYSLFKVHRHIKIIFFRIVIGICLSPDDEYAAQMSSWMDNNWYNLIIHNVILIV